MSCLLYLALLAVSCLACCILSCLLYLVLLAVSCLACHILSCLLYLVLLAISCLAYCILSCLLYLVLLAISCLACCILSCYYILFILYKWQKCYPLTYVHHSAISSMIVMYFFLLNCLCFSSLHHSGNIYLIVMQFFRFMWGYKYIIASLTVSLPYRDVLYHTIMYFPLCLPPPCSRILHHICACYRPVMYLYYVNRTLIQIIASKIYHSHLYDVI